MLYPNAMEVKHIYLNKDVNDIAIICNDGYLWFSEHILYDKTKSYAAFMVPKPEDSKFKGKFMKLAYTMEEVYIALETIKNGPFCIPEYETLSRVYELCQLLGARTLAIDNMAEAIANTGEFNSLKLLLKWDDDNAGTALYKWLKHDEDKREDDLKSIQTESDICYKLIKLSLSELA